MTRQGVEQAKRVHRRFPGEKGWVWCWDTTPWGGGHVVDRGAIGAVKLPDGGYLYLDSGLVTHPVPNKEELETLMRKYGEL